MEKLKHKLFSAAIGISSGLLPLSNCYGNTCNSCFKCAGVGIGLFLIMVFNYLTRTIRERSVG